MYLLFPVMMAGVIAGLADWTEQAYFHVYQSKRCQIAVDNALFELARLDRDLFKYLAMMEATLHHLHRLHHPLHLCGQNVLTAWKCLAADRAIEVKITAFHRMAHARAEFRWISHPIQASRAWEALELQRGSFRRALHLPALVKRCSICQLPVGWELQVSELGVHGFGCSGSDEASEAAIEWKEAKDPLSKTVRKKYQYRLVR